MVYPVKIEFKEYPFGSWQDWSQYLSIPPTTSQRVESENEGESGVIVFDSATVTFRYESGNPVYTAFNKDLTSVQRYLFRIHFPKSDKSPELRMEGMADFSTITWNLHENEISFDIVDKLSALGILSAEHSRVEDTLNARILAQVPNAHFLEYDWVSDTELHLSISDSSGQSLDLTDKIIFPGELIRHPGTINPITQPEAEWLIVKESKFPVSSPQRNELILAVPASNTDGGGGHILSENGCKYLSKELYGVDINNISGGVLQSLKGMEIILALYNQAWPGTTLIKKPVDLTFDVPCEYAVRLIDENPFGENPLDALITFTNSIKPSPEALSGCYVYVNKDGNLVIHARNNVSNGGTARSLGSTKIIGKERKYFWNKIVDGATVTVKSWIKDPETGEYLTGAATKTLQASGSTGFIKPKNKIEKEMLVDDPELNTQEALNNFAAQEAQNLLNFYGKRRSCLNLTLDLDDNTILWQIMDTLTLNSIEYFFTSVEVDPVSREIIIEAVETLGNDYDFRQIIVALSEANSIRGTVVGTSIFTSGSGSGSYIFDLPLLNSGNTISLLKTGNFKITGNALDTTQDILTTSTPTFNQVTLSSAGSINQAVRADRTITGTAPITGGGNLTANRSIGLSFNATNLKLTSNALNTIQDIHTTAQPTFQRIHFNNGGYIHASENVDNVGGSTLATTLSGRPNFHITMDVYGNDWQDCFAVRMDTDFDGVIDAVPFVVKGNKRVGINQINPQRSLHVEGDGVRLNRNGTSGSFIELYRENNLAWTIHGGVTSETDIFSIRNSANADRFTIKQTGEVGIGTSNPIERLHLKDGHFKQEGNYSLYNNFTSGWAGSGWRIDYNITSPSESTIEADNMFLRGTLSVYELLIQQIRATNGTVYVTACGKIKSVATQSLVTVEDPSGHDIAPFLENDIVIVQRVNLDSSVVVKRVIKRISSVSGTVIGLASLAGAPADVGSLEPGDDLIRIGNTTNAARQGSVYLTADDSNAPFIDIIDNVTAWSDWKSPAKLKARIGKLSGITDAVYGSLSGYGIYTKRIYLSSGNTSGISLYADSADADNASFIIRKSGNIKFSYTTSDEKFKLGTNISSNATTSFDFSAADGQLRLGFLAASKANLFFDGTALKLRINTSDRIVLNPTNDTITIGNTLSSNVLISSSSIQLRAGATAKIQLNNDGSGFLASNIVNWNTSGIFNIGSFTVNTDKITFGTAATGFALNTTASPFITGNNSKGFEVYNFSGTPKMFLGMRNSSGALDKGFDFNITTANELTLKGTILASRFSTKNNFDDGITISDYEIRNKNNESDLYILPYMMQMYTSGIEKIRLGNITGLGTWGLRSGGDFVFGSITGDPNALVPEVDYNVSLGNDTKKFLQLFAGELHVQNLVRKNIMATIGGRILIGETNQLVFPVSAGFTQITVKNPFTGTLPIICYLESMEAGFPKTEFIRIDSFVVGSSYTYNITRNLDGTGSNNWNAGDAVFNTGSTGAGFIDLYSFNGVKGGSQLGPSIVGNIRNSNTYNDWSEAWAIGNLGGLYGQSSGTFGVGLGKYADGYAFLIIEPTNGIRFRQRSAGLDVTTAQWAGSEIWLGDRTKAHTYISSTSLQLKSGSSVRIQINNDGSGFLADGTISWDSTGSIAVSKISASSGTIGGFNILSDSISSNDLELKTAGSRYIKIGSISDLNAAGYGFWAGFSYASDQYGFVVGNTDGLYIKYMSGSGNLVIKGDIHAVGGTFTGNITSSATISGGTLSSATIIGGLITTALSGQRVEISASTNRISIYDSANNLCGHIYGVNSHIGIGANLIVLGSISIIDGGTDYYDIYGDVYGININSSLIVRGSSISIGVDTILYRSAINTLKTDDGFHIKQPSNTTWGSGLRLINASNEANVWDIMQGSSNQLIFGYSGSTKFSINNDGTISTNINTSGVYQKGGVQVVGSRRTGWSAASGTATRTSFATGSVSTAQLAERVKALIDDLMSHGLIGN